MGIWDGTVEYVDLNKCKKFGLYRLKFLHFQLGVFNTDESCFIGLRNKLAGPYLFPAFHVDYDVTIGMCLPIELLEICPVTDLHFRRNAALAEYLMLAEEKYPYVEIELSEPQ